jgi:hypothetical protein
MKKLLLFISIGLIVFSVNGQKTAGAKGKGKSTIKLGKKEDVSDITYIPNKGFLLTTAVGYAGREKDVKIHSYRPDLSKRWTASISNSTNKLLNNYLVASEYSDYVYMIKTSKVFTTSNGKLLFTRIDSTGKKSDFSIPVSDEMDDATPVALFQNKDNLYFLVSNLSSSKEKVKDAKGKTKKVKKTENKLSMYIMAHDKKLFKRKLTEIKLESGVNGYDLTIEYLGNNNENIFVAQKLVNLSSGETKYVIYTLNNEGDIEETTEIEAKIKYTPLAALNYRNGKGAVIMDNDYRIETYYRNNRQYIEYIAQAGAFGCSQLDVENGYFYIYGLAVSKPATNKKGALQPIMSNNVDAFYIQKFDMYSGELIKEYNGTLPKGIVEDKIIKSGMFINKGIALDVVDSNTMRLNVVSYNTVNVVTINMEENKMASASKAIRRRKGETLAHRLVQSPLIVTKEDASKEMINHIKKFDDFRAKEYSLFGLTMGAKTAVIQNFSMSKDPRLEFTLFDNSTR